MTTEIKTITKKVIMTTKNRVEYSPLPSGGNISKGLEMGKKIQNLKKEKKNV